MSLNVEALNITWSFCSWEERNCLIKRI